MFNGFLNSKEGYSEYRRLTLFFAWLYTHIEPKPAFTPSRLNNKQHHFHNTMAPIMKFLPFLAVLLGAAAANPIANNVPSSGGGDFLAARGAGAITCANVRCTYRCEMVDNRPKCIPKPPPAKPQPKAGRAGEKCGKNTCGLGERCCNASCGICTAPDGMCTQQICTETRSPAPEQPEPEPEAAAEKCGKNTCGQGEYCCNESCGICAAVGGQGCTKQFCTEPQRSAAAPEAVTAQKCGKNTCGSNQYCCNTSCGICAPIGGACTQQWCGSSDES